MAQYANDGTEVGDILIPAESTLSSQSINLSSRVTQLAAVAALQTGSVGVGYWG